MSFHIEISSALDRARVLNFGEAELHKQVLEPWVAGLAFEFEGRDWEPRESRLTILEGPGLEPDAGADESWANALRAADDVTRPMLEAAEASIPAQVAVVVEADSLEAALKALGSGKSPQRISWEKAAERIGDRDPEISTVILVVRPQRVDWPKA